MTGDIDELRRDFLPGDLTLRLRKSRLDGTTTVRAREMGEEIE